MSSRARLSDCQMPSNRWCNDSTPHPLRMPRFIQTIAPLNTCTHTIETFRRWFFFLVHFSSLPFYTLFYICTTDSHFTPRAFVEKWKSYCSKKKRRETEVWGDRRRFTPKTNAIILLKIYTRKKRNNNNSLNERNKTLYHFHFHYIL